MKPVLLEMEAFGPYASKASVDFEPLADVGLFVVSGPTGAGKSTIFDAICFALYGTLSGSRQSHVDVRSHYADPAAECRVRLVFDAHGERWRVTRQPAQIRQKRRGIGTTERPADAALERWTEEGWAPDSAKIRDVTARCRELVGLSIEQFERVVLLPQGKFAEVLNARTADRADLLRTLFGSELFERVGEILAEQARVGERELAGAEEQRQRFWQRGLDAVERAVAEVADLPTEVAKALSVAAAERQAAVAAERQAAVAADTSPVMADALDHDAAARPDDQPSALGEVSTAQLSLLEPQLEVAVGVSNAGVDADSAADDPVDDPVARLSDLETTVLVDLASVVATAEAEALTARAHLDRAESQAKAIEQRRSATAELTSLEGQRAAMTDLARRVELAEKVDGLAAAAAERDRLVGAVDQRRDSINSGWVAIEGSLADPIVIPGGADLLAGGPTAASVSSLLEQVAARSSAIEALVAKGVRLAEQRTERDVAAAAVVELDARLGEQNRERAALVTEQRALRSEIETLEPTATQRPALALRSQEAQQRVDTRRRADAVSEKIEQLERHLADQTEAVTTAQAALDTASGEIAVLDALLEQRPARLLAVEQIERRRSKRGEIDDARVRLEKLSAEAARCQRRADEVFAAFVHGTAPRLAAELVTGEPCPVCGACEHPAPADDTDASTPVVDVGVVEAASANAAEAHTRRSECQARLAALVADDPGLADVDIEQFDIDLAVARDAVTELDRVAVAREELASGIQQLEQRKAAELTGREATEAELATASRDLAAALGELGDGRDRSLDQLLADHADRTTALEEADAARTRIFALTARVDAIGEELVEIDAERSRCAVERASAVERIEHLGASIERAEAQREEFGDGADLESILRRLTETRTTLLNLQHDTTALASASASLDAAVARCAAIVGAAGFVDETDALAAVMPADQLEADRERHRAWRERVTSVSATVVALEAQDLPQEVPDITALREAAIGAEARRRSATAAVTSITQHTRQAAADLAEVETIDLDTSEQRRHHEIVRRVASVVRGNNSRRLSLENWVLSVYLEDVVEHANLHLHTMSNGRYRLLVQDAPTNQIGQHGLDLVVDDAHTGRVRPSVSLSGGETFQASLALALGLADVVMVGRAGLHLDALFVDEGFGSLDADSIDQAIGVLDGLRSRGSMVGVITHVEALKHALPVAIDVRPRTDQRGSEIRQVA